MPFSNAPNKRSLVIAIAHNQSRQQTHLRKYPTVTKLHRCRPRVTLCPVSSAPSVRQPGRRGFTCRSKRRPPGIRRTRIWQKLLCYPYWGLCSPGRAEKWRVCKPATAESRIEPADLLPLACHSRAESLQSGECGQSANDLATNSITCWLRLGARRAQQRGPESRVWRAFGVSYITGPLAGHRTTLPANPHPAGYSGGGVN